MKDKGDMMTEPRLSDELQKMKGEYEPLLPIERQLIWYTFGTGVVLLVVLVFVSRAFV
jgi:hypothetical protein